WAKKKKSAPLYWISESATKRNINRNDNKRWSLLTLSSSAPIVDQITATTTNTKGKKVKLISSFQAPLLSPRLPTTPLFLSS
ncbi:hypothetical protein U1Q18_018158, partial [Sarracenia purpurea var. burkii]